MQILCHNIALFGELAENIKIQANVILAFFSVKTKSNFYWMKFVWIVNLLSFDVGKIIHFERIDFVEKQPQIHEPCQDKESTSIKRLMLINQLMILYQTAGWNH